MPLISSCFDEVTRASATSALVSDTRAIGAPISSTVDCPTMISTELVASSGAPAAGAAPIFAGAAIGIAGTVVVGVATVGGGSAIVAVVTPMAAVGAAIVAVGTVMAAASGSAWAWSPSVPQTAITRINTPPMRTYWTFCR